MRCTRTITSAGPTLVDDRPDAGALAAAGWSEADLTWEIIQATAAEHDRAGEAAQAAELWEAGLVLAREHFSAADPRRATSLANAALARRRAGDAGEAAALLDLARRIWESCGDWVAALRPEVRARSATYHLRLQGRYQGGYDHFSQARYQALVETGRAATRALRDGESAGEDRFARWRKECPAGYSDARKLMAAALLIAADR